MKNAFIFLELPRGEERPGGWQKQTRQLREVRAEGTAVARSLSVPSLDQRSGIPLSPLLF